MSIQYTDESWSDTEPLPQAVETFNTALVAGTTKRLAVGTKQEIDKEKKQVSIEDQLDKLTKRISDLEQSNSGIIQNLTSEEIRKFGII